MSLLRIKQADGSWSNIPAIKGADGVDGVDGKDGAIQYTAGRYIQIDDNTNTINCTVKIGDLVIVDAVPVKDSTNVVSSGGVYDALEAKADKTDIAGLGSEAGFITSSVEDLKNYYKKSETYSQEEVNSLIGNLTRLTLQVVETLPEVGTEQIIYLVPNNESGSNIYEEWIFVQSKWEMIGSTDVNLSDYYTKEEIDDYFQDDLLIYPIKYDIPSNNPYWVSVGSTLETLFINKINEVYKSGKTNFIISIIHIGDPSNRFNCRVRISNSGTSKTISFTALPVLLCDTNGLVTRRCYGNYSYGGGYTYSLENDVFKHKATSGNAFALFNYASDGGAYVKPADVLTKTNTTSFTPTANYHPATKKYVDDAVANAEAGGGGNVDLSNVLTKDNTEEFTPDGDYEPATKKYVDDAVSNSSISADSTNTIYEIKALQNMGTSISDFWSANDIVLEAMNKYLKNETNIPSFRVTGVAGNTTIYSRDMYLGISNISNLTFTYIGSHLAVQESGWDNTLMLHDYKMTFTLRQDSATGNYVLNGSISWDYSRRRVLAEGINASYTPSGDYHPATKKYVDDAVASVSGGSGGDSEGQTDQVFKIFSNDVTIGYDNSNADLCAQLGEILGKVYAIRNNYTSGAQIIWVDAKDYLNVVFRSKPGSFGTFYGLCYLPKVSDTVEETLELKPTYTSKDVDGVKVFNVTKFRISKITVKRTATDPTESYQVATKNYVDNAVANAGGETPDLTPYAKLTDVLTKTNTTEYTPASAYHPATKQYVDQTVASAGGITEESDPTVPLHVKNITQDMISDWNNKLGQDALTGAIDTAINDKELITFVDSCKYPTITGKYDLTVYVGDHSYSPSGKFINPDFDQLTPELITDLIHRELEKIAASGKTLTRTSKVNGEDALIKYVTIKLPVPSKLQADDEIELYAWGNESFNGKTDLNNNLIKRYFSLLESTGTSQEMTFRYSGQHPEGPSVMTMSYLDIDYSNDSGDIVCSLSIPLSVTYNSDTDIVVTKFGAVNVAPFFVRQRQGATPKMLSDLYLDTYIEAEETSNGTYDFSGVHGMLRTILYKKSKNIAGLRLKDLLSSSIPIVVRRESTYNGAAVTTEECMMLQIVSVSTADSKVYDTTVESGILGGGVDGTYDMRITFADYSNITSKNTSQATLQIRHADLYLNFDDILNTPDEPQYAYKGSFEWYTLNRQEL